MTAANYVFLSAAGLCVILGVLTMVPRAAALQVNRMNFKSICSFSPWSTLMMVAIALFLGFIGLRV